MTEVQALLVIAYVLMTALLMLVLMYGRLHFLFKLLLVVMALGLYHFSYQGWKQVQGWPSQSRLPDYFILHASVIQEPDQESGSKGHIFVWASELEDSFPADEPRAYLLPYDQEVHSSLEDALRNMRNGVVELGARKAKKAGTKNADFRFGVGEENFILEFTPLPDPALPEK